MSDDLVALGQQAVAAAYSDELRTALYTPDVAMLNYYNDTATMGMHQDKDEHIDAPIVSISLGNSCVFRFGNCVTRTKPYRDVTLHSGDVFVFGGESRMAFHGVTKVLPHSAPRTLPGGHQRINITLRMTGI